jgi:thiol-disulfide isomerase/thioredoxin
MPVDVGVLALLVTLVLVAIVGVAWRHRQGTVRMSSQAPPLDPALLDELGVTLGNRGTLVQFSTAFCQPCRATRQVLARVAVLAPGVVHVDVDAESHLAAVRALHISSTPTTLILDADGRERHRATGVPRVAQVYAALGVPVPAAADLPGGIR